MKSATDRRLFDPACRRCPRLADFLAEVRVRHPDYHAAPVPPFGDPRARLLVVGLAPGMHGANATGRPFTGDHAGILLYATLHRFGFASQAEARTADDGLELVDCRINNAVKCLPPQNKPTPAEVATCRDYLAADLARLPADAVIVALGRVAHESVLRARGVALKTHPFAHAAEHALADGPVLIDSYHCSRYNTQTGRLTAAMFEAVFARARDLLGPAARA
ncbi:MAG: uracil-DNA glycosylase [Gammaproteobacteria bacterium]